MRLMSFVAGRTSVVLLVLCALLATAGRSIAAETATADKSTPAVQADSPTVVLTDDDCHRVPRVAVTSARLDELLDAALATANVADFEPLVRLGLLVIAV